MTFDRALQLRLVLAMVLIQRSSGSTSGPLTPKDRATILSAHGMVTSGSSASGSASKRSRSTICSSRLYPAELGVPGSELALVRATTRIAELPTAPPSVSSTSSGNGRGASSSGGGRDQTRGKKGGGFCDVYILLRSELLGSMHPPTSTPRSAGHSPTTDALIRLSKSASLTRALRLHFRLSKQLAPFCRPLARKAKDR